MLISVVIPAYRAAATIARAVTSLLRQTWTDWEGIVVSDDGTDYAAVLRRVGIADERLRFVSTGRVGSGCHRARNVGLAAARGELIAALDADDLLSAAHIETLRPVALAAGAAAGNVRVVDEATGAELHRAFASDRAPDRLGIAALLDLSVPLLPLVAREQAEPRIDGIEFGEDLVANLRLIERLRAIQVTPECLYEYRVIDGSLCHHSQSARIFEQSYSSLIARLETGDRMGLSPKNAALARDGLLRKRNFNRAFAAARLANPKLNFQTFAAGRRRHGSRVNPASRAPY